MTRDEILSLARQAGFQTGVTYLADGTKAGDFAESVGANCLHSLEQFAALVAAAEREECAKACEAIEQEERRNWVPGSFCDVLRREAAASIRARSQSGDTP